MPPLSRTHTTCVHKYKTGMSIVSHFAMRTKKTAFYGNKQGSAKSLPTWLLPAQHSISLWGLPSLETVFSSILCDPSPSLKGEMFAIHHNVSKRTNVCQVALSLRSAIFNHARPTFHVGQELCQCQNQEAYQHNVKLTNMFFQTSPSELPQAPLTPLDFFSFFFKTAQELFSYGCAWIEKVKKNSRRLRPVWWWWTPPPPKNVWATSSPFDADLSDPDFPS